MPPRRHTRPAPRRPLRAVRTAIRAVARETASGVYRDAILGAAQAEFTDRGYAATKMIDIARRSGMSVGALYRHFENKEAIFASLMDASTEDVLERMARTARAIDDPRARIAEMMRVTLTFLEEKRGMFLVFAQLSDADRAHCHALVDKSRTMRERFQRWYREALADGVARGVLRDDLPLDDQLAFVTGALQGFIQSWFHSGGEGRLADKSELIASLTMRALGGIS